MPGHTDSQGQRAMLKLGAGPDHVWVGRGSKEYKEHTAYFQTLNLQFRGSKPVVFVFSKKEQNNIE